MKPAHAFVALSFLALAACSTMQGLKSDLSTGYDAVAGTLQKAFDPVIEEKKKLPVYDGSCPPISVRPDLARLVEFQDPTKNSDSMKISEVMITGVSNTCRVENNTLAMQIDLSFMGTTGPKARVNKSDKPSFAYPYFVAVTDSSGNVVSKEIFATTLAYGTKHNAMKQTETVFQTMPFPDASQGITYSVIVGFQLTPEQLGYNQNGPNAVSTTVPKPVAKPKV